MFAVVVIPDFALQSVLRHEPGLRSRAVALVDPALPRPNIIQLTAAARAQGVEEGQTPSQAMARCGDLIIRARSPAQEASVTEILLQTACAFSPNIESTAPGVCTLELKGLGLRTDRRSEEWAQALLRALAQLQLEAQIGFSATPELALMAARTAKPVLTLLIERTETFTLTLTRMGTSAGPQRAGVNALPVAALEPSPELRDILHRWGIQTIGAFLALGKDRVVERLGPAAGELFDRVSTAGVRPLKLAAPPAEFSEQMEFEHEIETIEPLLFVLRRFVEQLSRRLELIYLVVGEFRLRLGLAAGGAYERTFKIPSPTGRIETLFRMLQTHLETVRTDAPITSLQLSARPCKPETHQFGLFESTLRDPNRFAETLARLAALFGPDRAGTPQLQATHRPDAFCMGQAFAGSGGSPTAAEPLRIRTSPLRTAPVKRHAGTSALQLRRFRPALPAQVEFRDEHPALLRSPVFTGAIIDARGPFVTSGNWWDAGRWSRAEWDIQAADGTLFRIYRSEDGCFVEGVYD